MNHDRLLLAALAVLSAAGTAQQVALMQVLGWMHWHHFAYLIVAVALLGYGIAGTVLTLARDRLVARQRAWLPWLGILTAVTIPLGIHLAQGEAFAVDLPLVFLDPARNAWRLGALCLLLLPPFFCSGLAAGLILVTHAGQAGRYYAASLGGSGVGGLLGLGLVANLTPPLLPAATASIAFIAAVCFLFGAGQRGPELRPPAPTTGARPSGILLLGTGAAALFLSATWIWPTDLQPSQFKPLRRTLDLPGATIVAAAPSVHGWIQIVDAPALRPAPAISFDYPGEIPLQRAVFVNGVGYGSLLDATAARAPTWLDYTTDAAVFVPTTPRSVLLLENGPGGWAALAAAKRSTRITVVEPNHALVALLTNTASPLAPEWKLPGVAVITASGRAHLQQTREKFDVIRFPTVGALGGSAGLTSTSEQFLLTREAFTAAWEHLEPQGIIAVTAWMDFPERNALRLLATLVETAVDAGVTPRAHLAGIRGWATVTYLLRRTPWSASEVAALRAFNEAHSFDSLLLPDLKPEEREQYHAWQNPGFFDHVDQLVDGPRDSVYRGYPFLLHPTQDDRPYFSQFFRWTSPRRIVEAFGARTLPFFELGSLTVALTLIILSILAVLGIVIPLIRLRWRAPGKAAVLLYFGGLGAGFMFVEIGLILSAHAWLGSPVLATAVVLTSLLLASGLGSLRSERRSARIRTQQRPVAVIAAGIVGVALIMLVLGATVRTWPVAAQLVVLVGLVGPLGAAMGTAFPLGIRRLETIAPSHVPWAWAVNGCISVATPAAAMLLAMTAGFTALFFAAAAAYGIALVGATLAGRT